MVSDELPKEQARVQALLGKYKSMGASGKFMADEIEGALDRARIAIEEDDPVLMCRAIIELERIV